MKFTPTYERVEEISRKLNINWQDAHNFASVNNPQYDNIVYNMPNWSKGELVSEEKLYFEFYTDPIATNCICGYSEFEEEPKFTGTYKQTPNINSIVICPKCGVGRLPLIPLNYQDFYLFGIYAKQYADRFVNFEHEEEVASKRYNQFMSIVKKDISNALEIGCGIGAMQKILSNEKISNVGIELYNQNEVYGKRLSDNVVFGNFLICHIKDKFDCIMMYDLIEHVYEAKNYLMKCIAILRKDGILVIEIPDMGVEEYKITKDNERHLRVNDFEHIWYFTERGMKELIKGLGMETMAVDRPIPGKLTFYIRNCNGTTAKIGVPPGIGDTYWCLLKLEDYKRKSKIDKLILYVKDSSDVQGRDFNRSGRLLDLVNFVDEYHYVNLSMGDVKNGSSFGEYIDDHGNIQNLDLILCPNSHLEKGQRIESWLPDYDVNFDMEICTEDVQEVKQSPLILICSLDESNNKSWLNGFGKEEWAKLVETLAKKYKTKPVIVGAEWDKPYIDSWLSLVKNKKPYINLSGELSFKETCGLFKRAHLLISVISGASIVTNHFQTPTIALSPNFLHSTGFAHTWTRPDYKKYYSIDAFKEMGDDIINLADTLLEEFVNRKSKSKKNSSKESVQYSGRS